MSFDEYVYDIRKLQEAQIHPYDCLLSYIPWVFKSAWIYKGPAMTIVPTIYLIRFYHKHRQWEFMKRWIVPSSSFNTFIMTIPWIFLGFLIGNHLKDKHAMINHRTAKYEIAKIMQLKQYAKPHIQPYQW